MKKRLLAVFVLLIALLFSQQAIAKEISIGTYVTSIEEYDIRLGKYTVHFFLVLDCDFNCSIDDLLLLNGRATEVFSTGVHPQTGLKAYRVTAQLEDNVELQRYPFDSQRLTIIIEQTGWEKIRLQPNLKMSGVDPRVTFPGWDVDSWNAKVVDHYYEPLEDSNDMYIFSIHIDRAELNAFFKHFVPIFFLIIIMLFTAILGIQRIELRLGIVSSILIAAILLHLNISNQLPPLGYLTFADKFMVLTYLITLAWFMFDLSLLRLVRMQKLKLAQKINRKRTYIAFIGVPLLYVLLFVFFI